MKKTSLLKEPYIGIFNDSFPPIYDGVTLTVMNYLNWLIKKGYPACIVTPWNPESGDYPFEVIRYFSLPIRSRHPYRYGYPKLDPFIWHRVKHTPFRIIHSHSPFSAGRLGVYAKRKQGVPLIGTFHSKYKSDLQHSFKHAPWCVPIIMRRILNFYNACDEVWIPQASVADTVREYGYTGHLEVVDNGIDYEFDNEGLEKIKKDARHLLDIDDNTMTLLFVGQHIWEKGIGVIVDALDRIKDKLDFKMYFIGDGYARKELVDKVKGLGLEDRIFIKGVIRDRDTLKRYYAAADLFVFPSLYDNAPLVVREAAAMGTPSIIPENSTASEVIKPGFNGFLAQRSAEKYSDLILRLSGNKDSLISVGKNARDTLIRSWEDVVGEVIDRYEVIMKKFNR